MTLIHQNRQLIMSTSFFSGVILLHNQRLIEKNSLPSPYSFHLVSKIENNFHCLLFDLNYIGLKFYIIKDIK